MIGRFKAMIRSERQLSPEIKVQLIDGLFHPFASFVAGAVAGLWIAIMVTVMVDDLLVRLLAYAVVMTGFLRVYSGILYLRLEKPLSFDSMLRWQWIYGAGAAGFAAALGVLCMVAILVVDNSPLHLVLTTTTAGYAASITGRNAGRPWIAISQLYLAAGPMCLGLILHPGIFYQVVGTALFLFMFGMTDITLSVRKTIVGALETKRENANLAASFEEQANLFDAALNNMSHGLCMFDADDRLMVWNEKLSKMIGSHAATLKACMHLDDLLLALARTDHHEEASHELVAALRASLKGENAHQSFVRLGDERVIAISRQRMDNDQVVVVFEDVTEQTKANERIQQLAWTDELTGLMNRASFNELLKKSIAVLPADARIAVHLIDLDHFKTINDTLGHPTGDLLLNEVAKRMTDICHELGHVARLGGDEFIVLQKLPAQNLVSPQGLANSIISALSDTFEIGPHRINIGASIGIALAPLNGTNADILLKRADMALYRAKASGRNCFEFFQDSMDTEAQQRRMLELDIRQALDREEFKLAFQPITEARTGRITAFETLIRWHHPVHGYVSPGEFIPVAEEAGLITQIGRWVLEEAVRTVRDWPTDAAVAVNFSAMQFHDKNYPLFVLSVLNKYGFPPERLELEITETALLQYKVPTLEMLELFRSIGIKISLDDFGTGYSSLSQLRLFPFHKIKIDGSFVRDIGHNVSSTAIIRAVANIGQLLGMTVVAECVETEEQVKMLIAEGCHEVQGYLIARPQSAEDIVKLLVKADGGILTAGGQA